MTYFIVYSTDYVQVGAGNCEFATLEDAQNALKYDGNFQLLEDEGIAVIIDEDGNEYK